VTTPVLEVRDLHVWYDTGNGDEVHALRGASFEIAAGQGLGLVGESGCGKSTAVMALMGLLPASASAAGQVLLDGKDLLATGEAGMRPHRWRDIATVFQGAMNAFSPVTTVGAQIAEPMRVHGTVSGKAAARRRVAELLELVGIHPDRAGRYPHEFSGGMRQRAAIAMALACEPKVLLADEPTTALDVIVQAQVLDLLDRLRRELDLAVLLVTHDLPVVSQVCERVAVMYAGRVVESGSVAEMLEHAVHPYSARLFATIPRLDGGRAASIPGLPPQLAEEWAGCSFAPRCQCAFAACQTVAPVPITIEGAHMSECHLHDTEVPR